MEPRDRSTTSDVIERVIDGPPRNIGGFSVRRVLPAVGHPTVGPFIFFDHLGPVEFAPGHGMDVRPHPHIGLATITYLLEGELVHRDTLGTVQTVRPGDVNWMVAGRGVAHSERSSPEVRARGSRSHGLQAWVALPREREDMAPVFEHHPRHTLPLIEQPGVSLRVLAGSAYGQTAPTGVLSPTLYVHATMTDDATLAVDDSHAERAAYVIDGELECDGRTFGAAVMIVFRAAASATLRARSATNVILVGGGSLDGPREIWWNFVASSEDRIEAAKIAWRADQFGTVFGDEDERIPLPDR